MPHYVTQLDDRDGGLYAVYSTVVDNLITGEMSAAEMRAWLDGNGYGTWLLPPGDNSDLDGYDEVMRRHIIEWRERTARWMYWDAEHGFQYVRQTDNYFTLPREDWRDE